MKNARQMRISTPVVTPPIGVRTPLALLIAVRLSNGKARIRCGPKSIFPWCKLGGGGGGTNQRSKK
jgi:hypothetical protein